MPDGHAHRPAARSKLTIEDLKTKIGTAVNGRKIKGAAHVVEDEALVTIVMGKCPEQFRCVAPRPPPRPAR